MVESDMQPLGCKTRGVRSGPRVWPMASSHRCPLYSAIYQHLRFVGGDSPVKTGLTVIAHITAKTGHEDRVREALLDLVAETRKEKGCINYDLHPSEKNAAQFPIYENWDKAADLEAHAKSSHLRAFAKAAGHLLDRPAEITKWLMVSELRDNN
jgi:quinol monooxygenase YgiN